MNLYGWKIIDCGLTNSPKSGNVCNPIYLSQNPKNISDYHIPEPWNGDIENAPILFVSHNPGYTQGEEYPCYNNPNFSSTAGLNIPATETFYDQRFEGKYVKHDNGKKFKVFMANGQYKSVHGFWNYAYNISVKLLGKSNVIPGKDFAISDIVHCKSSSVDVIPNVCFDECMKRHFKSVLMAASNIRYMVVVGRQTRERIASFFKLNHVQKYKWYDVAIDDNNVKLIFVDQNAGGGTAKKIPQP